MTQSRKILATAALTGLGLVMTALTATPFYASARAAGQEPTDFASQRIEVAFASVREIEAAPAIEAAAERVQKGDLLARPGCFGEKWPNFSAACLMASDGSAAQPVRTVTIGYRIGETTSVLVRMPAPQVASR